MSDSRPECNTPSGGSEIVIENALDLFIEDFEEEELARMELDGSPDSSSTPELVVSDSVDQDEGSMTASVMSSAVEFVAKGKSARMIFIDILQEQRVAKLQKVHSSLTALQTQQAGRKDAMPRPLRQSVQSAYPLMLMNAINSSDLPTVQNFFGSYMSGPCTFVLSLKAHKQFGLPDALFAFGPQLFTHYMAGNFMAFPDMTVRMHGCRTIYAEDRTRIVIDVTVSGTKILDIPQYEWAPDLERMPDIYNNRPNSGTATPAQSGGESDSSVCTDNRAQTPTVDAALDANHGRLKDTKDRQKEKKSRRKKKPTMIIPSPANVAAAQRVPRIPMEYVMATVGSARMLPAPKTLHTRGSITLFLDAQNCMQHIAIDCEQDHISMAGSHGK